MKSFYKISADIIFLLHIVIFLIALFGWIFPRIWYLYVTTLALVLLSDLIFGYCLASKWEFDLRKKVNPEVKYAYAWSSYYTYKFTDHKLSPVLFERVAIVFLAGSLFLNLYFHYFL